MRTLPVNGNGRALSFLDVGCANGHLTATLTEWAAQEGIQIEPYGVDISAALAALARERRPRWTDRIWVGNAYESSWSRRRGGW